MRKAKETFWMVYGMGQHAPTMRHKTHASAKAEAMRLARSCPGITFYILETVGYVQKVDVEYEPLGGHIYADEPDDGLPF